jgi:hypothetical protein
MFVHTNVQVQEYAGIEPLTSCVVGEYSHHTTTAIGTRIWPACVKLHAATTQFEFLFSAGCVTV